MTNTGFILAHSHGLLFFAGWVSKICRRSPHVVDIALEILIGYKALGLSDCVFFAALLNYAPLVKRDSAIVDTPCPALKVDHSEYIDLLKTLRQIEGIKKVFIRSGIRFDYLMYDKSQEFLQEFLCCAFELCALGETQ